MTEIEKGSRVRVTFEGIHQGKTARGYHKIHVPGGPVVIPADADLDVVAPPLPPQPPDGSYVEVRHDDYSTSIYRRTTRPIGDVGQPQDDAWWKVGHATPIPRTWAQLHDLGTVTRLYREDEHPDAWRWCDAADCPRTSYPGGVA